MTQSIQSDRVFRIIQLRNSHSCIVQPSIRAYIKVFSCQYCSHIAVLHYSDRLESSEVPKQEKLIRERKKYEPAPIRELPHKHYT